MIAAGWRVLVDQIEAFALLDDLVDAEDWRGDKRAAWSAILRQLVLAMDWHTGLVCAVTAARLAAAGDRAARTVSRVLAWARDVGLLVVVEHGASAEFLGTTHGRTPSYALVTSRPLRHTTPPIADTDHFPVDPNPQLRLLVDELGDLPASCVENKPLDGTRLEHHASPPSPWPLFGIPETPSERTAATACLLQRLGLDQPSPPRAPLWRARALLLQWWIAGACPAAMLWALDHHPDRPQHHRGDALRGARDPLAVLGARLRPWRERLTELPAEVTGFPGNYTAARAARQARAELSATPATTPPPSRPRTRTAAHAAALAAWARHRDQLRATPRPHHRQP